MLAVATVLTVYGIETVNNLSHLWHFLCSCNSAYRLRYWNQIEDTHVLYPFFECCNSAYRLRYWNTLQALSLAVTTLSRCNSAYRLRYWNLIVNTACNAVMVKLQQCLPFTVLKLYYSQERKELNYCCNSAYRLRYWNAIRYNGAHYFFKLQQHLPSTVLKQTWGGISYIDS